MTLLITGCCLIGLAVIVFAVGGYLVSSDWRMVLIVILLAILLVYSGWMLIQLTGRASSVPARSDFRPVVKLAEWMTAPPCGTSEIACGWLTCLP
jgi:hypothetical protein